MMQFLDARPVNLLFCQQREEWMTERFTEKQGQYLAFIDSYITMYGRAPAEADLQRFFGITPPTVHQMILKLEEKELISRVPGQARSIQLLIDSDEIPKLKRKT